MNATNQVTSTEPDKELAAAIHRLIPAMTMLPTQYSRAANRLAALIAHIGKNPTAPWALLLPAVSSATWQIQGYSVAMRTLEARIRALTDTPRTTLPKRRPATRRKNPRA